MMDSDDGVEQEPGSATDAGGGATVVDRSPRGGRKRKASSGAAGMAESPTSRGGPKSPGSGRFFFELYKRTQGTYTRTGTAIGAGVLILAGGNFLYKQLAFDEGSPWGVWLQIGIPLAVLLVLGLLLWWVVGVKRTSCDFMIATEGEMKKVSWSNRKELFGSTKVVILFTVALAVILFLVDIVFMTFFNAIGVLRGASMREMFFGG